MATMFLLLRLTSLLNEYFVQVLLEEKLCENAEKLGKILLEELNKIPKNKIATVRGRGLMCAIVIHESTLFYDF